MELGKLNGFIREQSRRLGKELAEFGDNFADEMVALESITAAMIAMIAVMHNKQPESLLETFKMGLTEAVDRAIYGKKQ